MTYTEEIKQYLRDIMYEVEKIKENLDKAMHDAMNTINEIDNKLYELDRQ